MVLLSMDTPWYICTKCVVIRSPVSLEHCQRRALSSGRSFIQPAGPYSIYGHLLQQPCKNDSSKRALHCWWPVLLKAAGARASAKPLVKEELETEDSNEVS